MKQCLSIVLAVCFLGCLGLAGCETVQEHQKTAVGTGVGAAGGALAGGLIGHGATGAVVGGLVGALAGGAVGNYLERQDKSRQQAATDASYNPSQGDLVRIDSVQAQPTAVPAGNPVNIQTTYTVLTPNPNQQVTVQETRQVFHNGQLVANPSTTVTRANGTYTSSLPISLPPDADRGSYQVTTIVAMNGKQSSSSTNFTVQ
jgi:hypothetical protein